jgi:peroxiredoxin
MNRTGFRSSALSLLALCLVAGSAFIALEAPSASAKKAESAKVDTPVQNFKLRDLTKELKDNEKEDAALVALDQYRDKKPVVLFFLSEKCDTTWRYEKRVGQLLQKYGQKDVQFLAVRCSANDTPESIVKFAEAKNFDMPVLDDTNGKLTSYFKVYCTPTFALIDTKGVLRYKGSFDDSRDPAAVKKPLLRNAIAAVLTGKEVAVKQNPAFG